MVGTTSVREPGTCVHVGVVLLVAFVVGVDGACGWVVGLERLLARAACQGAAPMAAATRAAARTASRVGIRWGLDACKFCSTTLDYTSIFRC